MSSLLLTCTTASAVPMAITIIPNTMTSKAMIFSREHQRARDSFRKLAVGRMKARGVAVKQPCGGRTHLLKHLALPEEVRTPHKLPFPLRSH